jgi:hypothetical protein
MIVDRFLALMRRESFALVMSVVIGLGLAILFRASCHGRKCKVYLPEEGVEDRTYRWDGKCYRYTEEAVECGGRSGGGTAP